MQNTIVFDQVKREKIIVPDLIQETEEKLKVIRE